MEIAIILHRIKFEDKNKFNHLPHGVRGEKNEK